MAGFGRKWRRQVAPEFFDKFKVSCLAPVVPCETRAEGRGVPGRQRLKLGKGQIRVPVAFIRLYSPFLWGVFLWRGVRSGIRNYKARPLVAVLFAYNWAAMVKV